LLRGEIIKEINASLNGRCNHIIDIRAELELLEHGVFISLTTIL